MRSIYRAGRKVIPWAFFFAVAAAVALLVKGLYPADLPQSSSPDFIDNTFDNRGVLWAARLLLVSAAGVLAVGGVFIVVSIGIRMRNGEWLRRAGPFEISNRDANETEFWLRVALASREEAVTLRERLQSSEELIDDLETR
ncbi:MAG TPA: hypothetical protein VNC15_05740 [Solirubrobacterales bacterium]|nr:hypothetical protein [Solirubrobacterales bacterium]